MLAPLPYRLSRGPFHLQMRAEFHYAEFSDEAATRVRVCLITALAHLYDLALSQSTRSSLLSSDTSYILPANAATLTKLLRPVLPPSPLELNAAYPFSRHSIMKR